MKIDYFQVSVLPYRSPSQETDQLLRPRICSRVSLNSIEMDCVEQPAEHGRPANQTWKGGHKTHNYGRGSLPKRDATRRVSLT